MQPTPSLHPMMGGPTAASSMPVTVGETPISGNMGASSMNQPNGINEPYQRKSIFEQSSHPVALFFHLFFRSAALTTYLLGYYLLKNYVLVFVVCILFLSFDFWTVKNVTGRLLVGLRWWNEVLEDGTSHWVFESRENYTPNPADSYIFWTSLYVFPIVWVVFAILQILHPSWLCICFVALSLTVANVLGYSKCDKDAKKRLAGYGQSVLGTRMGQSVMSGFVARSFGGIFGR